MALSKQPLKPYGDQLVQLVQQHLPQDQPLVVYLEAGHFDPRFTDPEDLEFARESLQGAIDLGNNLVVEHRDRVRLVFGILVDNLGLNCGDQGCSIKPGAGTFNAEKDPLPAELEALLVASPLVKRNRVMLHDERNAKNRAIEKLRRKLKSNVANLVRVPSADGNKSEVFFRKDTPDEVLLANIAGDSWSAQCPLIMGQHYVDVFDALDHRYRGSNREVYPKMVIDFSEQMDRQKVTRGSQVGLGLFLPPTSLPHHIVNVCFWDPQGDRYDLDHFSANLKADE